MATIPPTTLNSLLSSYDTLVSHISLHTADPGTTGASEATGGSPAYARKAVTFAAAASAEMPSGGSTLSVDVPAGTYTYLGFWSALSAGTFHGGVLLAEPLTFSGQGVVTFAVADIKVLAEAA